MGRSQGAQGTCLMYRYRMRLTAPRRFAVQPKLPEIWRAAYTPDDPKAEVKAFTLWGVTINPHNPTTDARVSVVLMKFLRAKYVGALWFWGQD